MLNWANLKRYWREHLMHVLLAGVAGYFVCQWQPGLWALCILALIVSRQVMEWFNSAPFMEEIEGTPEVYARQGGHAWNRPRIPSDRQRCGRRLGIAGVMVK